METQTNKKIKITGEHISYVKELLKENFKGEVVLHVSEDCLYFTDNQHLTHPVILEVLSKYKLFVQPSLL